MTESHDSHMVAKLSEHLGIPDLDAVLGKSALRHLVPILTRSARLRAQAKDPPGVLREYEANERFFGPSEIDQRLHLQFAGVFAAALPATYDLLELAPIAPLGANSVLSRLSQDVTLTTIRGSEVIGDPTTSLALEAGRRRRKMLVQEETRLQAVNLATWHRVLRMQQFDSTKGYMQHFELFGLLSAGRDTVGQPFNDASIAIHIRVWLDLVNALRRQGWTFDGIRLAVSDTRLGEHLVGVSGVDPDEVRRHSTKEGFDLLTFCGLDLPPNLTLHEHLDPAIVERLGIQHHLTALRTRAQALSTRLPELEIVLDLGRRAGSGYYLGFCYHLHAQSNHGQVVQLADGGEVDWLTTMLTSRKERAVSSGFGAELVQKLFTPSG